MSASSDAIPRLETRVERAWREYVEARKVAEQTLDLRDGIEAGRAWQRFLDEFARPQ